MGDYISMLEGRDGGLGPPLGAADAAHQRLGLQPGAGSEAVQICNLFNELQTSGQQSAQPPLQQQQLPPHLLPTGSVFQAAATTPSPQQQQALSTLPVQRQGAQGGALPPLLPGHGPLVHMPHALQRSQQNTPPLPGAAPALSTGGAHSGLDAPLCFPPHMLHGGMPAAAAGTGGASASAKDAAAAARAARQRKRKEMAAAAAERAAAQAAAAGASGAGGGGSEGDDAGMAGLLLGEGSLGEGGLQESLEAAGSDERATRRMIKNRESAARSRARRQEYTASLESQVAQLRQQNRDLRVQVVLAAAAPADPHAGRLDGQLLRRTRTTPL